ncbi:MAG: hypothetical protein U0667_17290 [Chloroflexota bacterium]
MRIAWYSNSPKATSGYGTQTKMMLPRLTADGHEVSVLGLWGHDAGIDQYPTPSGPVPLWPKGSMHYGLDVVDAQARSWLGDQPGWVITLFDVWVLRNVWDGLPVASWTPVDHMPAPPGVLQWASRHPTIAMSRFGQRAPAGRHPVRLRPARAGATGARPSPGRPRPDGGPARWLPRDDERGQHQGAARGPGRRGSRTSGLLAIFARSHPDALASTSTPDPTTGPDELYPRVPLLPRARCLESRRITDLMAYRAGIDRAADHGGCTPRRTLLSCSMGEGFGLAVPEATPAARLAVTDFSAWRSRKIVADTGWLVDCEPWYDEPQRSDYAVPSVASIVGAA